MTYLSRLTKLGLIKEVTPYTWLAPGFSVPWNTAKFTDNIIPLRDESMRANDAKLQGLNQGPWTTTWELDCNGYPDLLGHFFRAIIGPDVVSAGVSTTLAADCAAAATTLSLTASVPNNSVIQISDATGANLEWVKVGTITGAGPFSAPVTTPATGTRFAHTAAGGSVLSQSTHTFTQNRSFSTVWPTYSLTTDDGQDQLGWPGCVMSELGLKIDPKGFITASAKYTGFPSLTEATFTYAASTVQPTVGWGWTVSNPGASTRGMTMDITLKREVEAIQSSDGLQSPREIFPGPLEIDGSYKAIYDSASDMNLFKQYLQGITTHTLTQPVTSGGQSLAVTMSKSGYTTGEADVASLYVSLSQAVSGIQNTTDSGVTTVVLKNYLTAAY
jgi:Phage tail tube protein